MLFMVIERFGGRERAAAVYRRFRERGRMMPDGLRYVASWVEQDFERCFQLVECEDPSLITRWTDCWQDIVGFEVVPVITSQEAADTVSPLL